MKRWLLSAINSAFVAAAAALGTTTAQAAFATAQLDALQIEVVDLDLTDGVNASYSFLGGTSGPLGYTYTYAQVITASEGQRLSLGSNWNVPTTLYAPDMATAAASGAAGTATVGPNGSTAIGFGFGSFTNFSANSDSSFIDSLAITPNTRITISAYGRAQAVVNDACGANNGCERAHAFLELGFYIGSTLSPEYVDRVSLSADSGNPGVKRQLEAFEDRFLSASFDNTTSSALTLGLTAQAFVAGGGVYDAPPPITPIPEPSTYALMVLGIACVVLSTRRHQRAIPSDTSCRVA